jgi:hypothetical protein
MPTIVAQIAPQRSTQYAALASALAPHELQLALPEVSELTPVELGAQSYLQFDLPAEPDEDRAQELGMLAMTSAFFVRYERLGEVQGPLLRPIETGFTPALPRDLMMARRYRGKTNELFTHFLCNVARFSSALARRPWDTLRVYDPLAGGGTTLFTALVLGASVAGVDHNAKDIQSTASFLRQFAREQRIPIVEKRERLKKVGQRWLFTLGKDRAPPDKGRAQTCLLSHGDTAESHTLISGFRPHLIVADLPYGVQHHGELIALLTRALPVWASLLPPSGAMVLAWESRRYARADMVALVESAAPLSVLNDPPYNQMAHRVDRVIKQRDVLVARLSETMHVQQEDNGPL